MLHYTVQSEHHQLRLDHYCSKIRPDLSRNFIQKIIREGGVFINHKKITKSAHRVSQGDEMVLLIPSLKEIGIQPEKIALDILYEDPDLIVINKPAGMVVHPTDHGAHVSGTLVNALMHHCRDLSGIGGKKRPGIVHRLDKDTSGILVAAKSDTAHRVLSGQFEKRQVKKVYLTLLKGRLKPAEGGIEAPLLKIKGEKNVRISGKSKAKYALTYYKVLEYISDYSLAEVRIVTGRTHQIRVHFAALGHPVCGDREYGDPKINQKLEAIGLKRQFLHAAFLQFRHPKTKKILEMKSPLPQDLQGVLENLSES